MRREGFALVAVLGVMVAVLMLGLSLSFLAQGNLETARNLRDKAQAKALAEGGIAHAVAYVESKTPTESKTLLGPQGSPYTASIIPTVFQGDVPTEYQVTSTATVGAASHTAKAILRRSYTDTSAPFQNGFLSGGTLSVNGQSRLAGTRIHGDGGYTLNGDIYACQEDTANCQTKLTEAPPAVASSAVSAGIYATTCNAHAPYRDQLCEGQGDQSRPKADRRVCPVWNKFQIVNNERVSIYANDSTACLDSLTGQTTTVKDATKLNPPTDLDPYLSRYFPGLELADDPYQKLAPAACDASYTSVTELLAELATLSQGAKVCFNGNLIVNSALNLNLGSLRLYVNGDVLLNGGTLTVNGGGLYASGNINFNGPAPSFTHGELVSSKRIHFNGSGGGDRGVFVNSKVYAKEGFNPNGGMTFQDTKLLSGASVNFNGNATFEGDVLIVVNAPSLTFNGIIGSRGGHNPLIVTSGSVYFNGSYRNGDAQAASYILSGGNVYFNGTVDYRGGVMAGGDITVNGNLALHPTTGNNSDLPRVQFSQIKVLWRR